MKLAPKLYAKAFCEAAAEAKNKEELNKIVKNFLKLLEKNRDQAKLADIFRTVERIISQKTDYRKITFESARDLTKSQEKNLERFVRSSDRVEKKIDPALVAGVKITINDELQFDGSFSKKLKALFGI